MASLAVIGGGPKAAAIAAKAHALNVSGYQTPEIHIFEPVALAASWTGQNGYTDGLQPLCTLAERDLGFPYDRMTFGDAAAEAMMAKFSWHHFSVAEGIDEALYENWVVQGRRPPAHRDFASYIVKAITDSQAIVRTSTIVGIDYDTSHAQWRVTSSLQNTQSTDSFDGVVVTGSGQPFPSFRNANARVFDGRSFWLSLAQISNLLQSDPTPSVGIIGAGGTAAAIAHWFVREGITEIPVTVIGREATLFIRTSTPFEDRLFTDEVAWAALAPHVRETFIARLTRGVVWDYVLHRLGDAKNIQYLSADVREFAAATGPAPAGFPPPIMAVLDDPPDPRQPGPAAPAGAPKQTLDATVFIDARGFDAWGFVNLLAANLRNPFANRGTITANVDYSLCVEAPCPAGLHVPMLASVQGPAAPNLMALGWMSDRVLSRYIQPAPIIAHWRQART